MWENHLVGWDPSELCLSIAHLRHADLLHSYFGMVSLAFQGEVGLESVDPALCASHRAVRHLHALPWWQERKSADPGIV